MTKTNHEAVVDAHGTLLRAAAAGRAAVQHLGELVDDLLGQLEGASETGRDPAADREVPLVDIQQDVGAVAGYVAGVVGHQEDRARHRAAVAFGARGAVRVQEGLVVGELEDRSEGLQEPLGFVGSLQPHLFHVVAVFLRGSHRLVLPHPVHWKEV